MQIIILLTLSLNILCYAQFAGGSGTVEDPYQIATAEQLNNIRYNLTASYIQTADIDLGVAPWNEGEGWDPIGDYDWADPNLSFRGNYNGDGYKILNMYINRPVENDVGLFGCCQTAQIDNIELENVDIVGSSNSGGLIGYNTETVVNNCNVSGNIEGQSSVGLLIGYNYCDNVITDCYSTGIVVGYLNNVGGLIGFNLFDNIVTNCGSEAEITSFRDFTGGLIGSSFYNYKIENCYSKGLVTSVKRYSGGLIGGSTNDSLLVNCYSKSTIVSTSDSSDFVGGLIGKYSIYDNVEIRDCYAAGQVFSTSNLGGLIGSITGSGLTISNSYWDMETSGIDSSAAGEGRTTAEMVLPYALNTYVGWDFDTVWRDDTANQNNGYPTFKWVSGIEHNQDDFAALAKGFELYQNYPNPFNPATTISFVLSKASEVKLSVYNIRGQKVAELANGKLNVGKHSIDFDGSKLNSGVYYYTLDVNGNLLTQKMVLVK